MLVLWLCLVRQYVPLSLMLALNVGQRRVAERNLNSRCPHLVGVRDRLPGSLRSVWFAQQFFPPVWYAQQVVFFVLLLEILASSASRPTSFVLWEVRYL